MTTVSPSTPGLRLAAFSADVWQHVCPVIRLTRPAELAGFSLIHGNEWDEAGRLHIFPERLSEADLVIIQRNFPLHTAAFDEVLALARAQNKPVAFELDDLLTELPDSHPDYLSYLSTRSAILRALPQVDAVIGSTPELCSYLAQYNSHVHLLPNYLDDGLWTVRQSAPAAGEKLVIGYMGGHSHAPDLEMITPALLKLLEKHAGRIQLDFWGIPPPPKLRDLPWVKWRQVALVSYREFAAYFSEQACDIFIAPLADNTFNRAKSSLKFLEYSALGAPGVYSRVQPYARLVEHGMNGLLASTSDEWYQALCQLVEDSELRLRLGAAARQTLQENWLLSGHVQEWADVYRSIHAAGSQPAPTALVNTLTNTTHRWQNDLEIRVGELTRQNRQLQQTLAAEQLRSSNLDEKTAELEATVIHQKETIAQRDELVEHVHGLYTDIMNSNSWRLLGRINQLRARLLPPDSRRERLLQLTAQSYRMLRHQGALAFVKGFGRSLVGALRRGSPPPAPALLQGQTPGEFRMQVISGSPLAAPAISILVVSESSVPDMQAVSAWAERQTCASFLEVIAWDRQRSQARHGQPAGSSWAAADFAALKAGLRGRWVCLASQDLLAQPETYLESNLVALASERLAFTLNLSSHTPWALERLQQGFLPGSSDSPLLRLVVDKAYVNDQLQLNLEPWLAAREGFPGIAARLILHTTRQPDQPEQLPFETPLSVQDFLLRDRYLLVRSQTEILWDSLPHKMVSPETALDFSPAPDTRPTVMIAQPFIAVGGAEQLALHIMENLKDKIRFVHVSCDELDASLGTLSDAFRQASPLIYNLPDFLYPEFRLAYLFDLIERYQPVAFYIHNGAAWLYDILPQLKQRFPALRTVNQVYDARVGWIYRYDLQLVMNMDAHIGANQKICQAYRDKGARPEQVFQVPHTIDPKNLNPADYGEYQRFEIKQKLGLPPESRVVTFAARLHPQKRPLDFIELARRFASDPTLRFLMLGDGPLAQTVDQQIQRIGLSNIVRRQFYRPISDILAVTDVLVLPSEYEGMPLIVAETQMMGKPVVVTDVGNNREVLELTGGGVVVPEIGDIGALEAGVRRMLQQPPDPEKTRQAVIDNFGVEVVSERYRKVLLGEPDA